MRQIEIPTADSLEALAGAPENAYRDVRLEREGFVFDYRFMRKPSDKLIVFLPGLLGREKRAAISPPFYNRWTWSPALEPSVFCVSDPCLRLAEDMGGGWFLGSRETFLVPLIVEHVAALAQKLSVPVGNVCYAGSSMGGWGALMMAMEMRGAKAYAEVPQIDLRAARGAHPILRHAFGDVHLKDAGPDLLARVSVVERIRQGKYVPPFLCVHHLMDHLNTEHLLPFLHFLNGIKADGEYCVSRFALEFMNINEARKHAVLPREWSVRNIARLLAWTPEECVIPGPPSAQKRAAGARTPEQEVRHDPGL